MIAKRSRRRRWMVAVCCALFLLAGGRIAQPWLYFAHLQWLCQDGVEGFRGSDIAVENAARRLTALGPRALPPLFHAVAQGSPWKNHVALLPNLLGMVGEPAHQQLLRQADADPDPSQRIYAVYYLQKSFGDYSCLGTWLNALPEYPESDRYLSEAIQECLEQGGNVARAGWGTLPGGGLDSMPLRLLPGAREGDRGRYSPAFLRWYSGFSAPSGPLPAWKPEFQG